MGKRQHQKDKMYLTYTEWSTFYGGKKAGNEAVQFRRLPFDHCCVSFVPYENPYCDLKGNIFELEAILKYHNKYKVNPVSGEPLDMKSLIKLNFSKDLENKVQCPILRKQFTSNSHVAAIAVTGNVFSFEAIQQLNLKNNFFRDLLSDEPFKKDDIIILQDPSELQKFNIENFFNVKNNHSLSDEVEINSSNNETTLKNINNETRAILDELKEEYKTPIICDKSKVVADKFNAAHYSTGAVAASFTSTSMPVETKHEPAIIDEDTVRYSLINRKGYVRLVTNFGHLNIELHCELVPKTCENFIKHCHNGYFNGTVFHRSIRHFMIQGGDPTGTGEGGESIWGKPFQNEIKPQLTHTGRGILSMVNSGPNTNKSQFFITYRSCRHLDGKHTVFGHVVGGLSTLSVLEKIEVDNKDKPIQDIIIEKTQVFIDPYQEIDEKLSSERQKELNKERSGRNENLDGTPKSSSIKSGVGKYINPDLLKKRKRNEKSEPKDESNELTINRKRKNVGYHFKDFKLW